MSANEDSETESVPNAAKKSLITSQSTIASHFSRCNSALLPANRHIKSDGCQAIKKVLCLVAW
eukprot:scaffold92524_cov32-Prasinocladus_malaysianus.AAC.1